LITFSRVKPPDLTLGEGMGGDREGGHGMRGEGVRRKVAEGMGATPISYLKLPGMNLCH